LFERETGTHVATLDDRDPNPITWLSFSPDGRRLAVARADRTAVWDLASLSVELQEIGLNVTGFPAISEADLPADPIAPTTIQVNRGSFPPADSWYTLWQRLAEDEAAEGNWPDAIDDMNRGLFHLPADAATKAAFLAQRGTYLQRNLSFQAACDDWEVTLKLVPDESAAATGLARLLVLGPPELRDPRRAVSLAAVLALNDDTKLTTQLLQAMARVRLAQPEPADQELLEAINTAGSNAALTNDWRIAAAYFLALNYMQSGDSQHAAETFAGASALHEERRSSLLLDQQQELDRLRSEVETELGRTIHD
jgi:hypothetical protein